MEFLEGDHLDFRLFSSSKVFVIGCCMYVYSVCCGLFFFLV